MNVMKASQVDESRKEKMREEGKKKFQARYKAQTKYLSNIYLSLAMSLRFQRHRTKKSQISFFRASSEFM